MQVGRHEPVATLLMSTLSGAVDDLRRRGAAVHDDEDDAVHQLRVRCRRLRTHLRSFRALYDDDRVPRLRRELAWLAESLDAARDLEVLCARVVRTATRAPWESLEVEPLVAELTALRSQAQADAERAVDGPRLPELLAVLGGFAVSPRLSERAERSCGQVLPGLVDHAWSRMARASAGLTLQAPPGDWHRTRILAKRARYTAETARGTLGHRAKAVAEEAQLVQEMLGEHHDAVVTAQWLADPARHGDRERAFLCGRLVEREHALARESELAFLEGWPRIRRLVEAG